MAKQHSPFTLTGTVGGITYYRMGDKYYARAKGGPSRRQIMHSSSFANTRKQMAEFGRLAKTNKMLREALYEHIKDFRSTKMVGTITKRLKQVLDGDDLNEVGNRKMMEGDPGLLIGLDLNANFPMYSMSHVPIHPVIDRNSGKAIVQIGGRDGQLFIGAIDSTTHYKFHLVALATNLDTCKIETREAESAMHSVEERVAAYDLEVKLPDPSNRVILLVLVLKLYRISHQGWVIPVAAGRRDMVTVIAASR